MEVLALDVTDDASVTSAVRAVERRHGALSQSLAWELATLGIRVVCIEPGFFATEISRKSWGAVDPTGPYGADHAWVNDFFVASGEANGGDPTDVVAAATGILESVAGPRPLSGTSVAHRADAA
jgi:NAD(P)-dependent dehydrogenase (short-subunit alcohol dehydrogenase family)